MTLELHLAQQTKDASVLTRYPLLPGYAPAPRPLYLRVNRALYEQKIQLLTIEY